MVSTIAANRARKASVTLAGVWAAQVAVYHLDVGRQRSVGASAYRADLLARGEKVRDHIPADVAGRSGHQDHGYSFSRGSQRGPVGVTGVQDGFHDAHGGEHVPGVWCETGLADGGGRVRGWCVVVGGEEVAAADEDAGQQRGGEGDDGADEQDVVERDDETLPGGSAACFR